MNTKNNNEIDLFSVVKVLWKYKTILIKSIATTTALAIAISFIITPKYVSSALLANVSSDMTRGATIPGGIGELASLAGVSLTNEADDSVIALATLKSNKLAREFIKKNNLLPVLYADDWDAQGETWLTDTPPTLWKAVKFFSEKVRRVSEDKSTGLITVSIEWTDAEISAEWAKGYIDLANNILQQEFQESNQRKLNFLYEQAERTQLSELRTLLFALIQEETKNLMLAEGRKEFAFKVIDMPVTPERPVSPRKSIFGILGILFGGLFGCALVFLKVVRSQNNPTG